MESAENRRPSPSPADVRETLERVVNCPEFKGSERRKAFLRYLVDAELAGHANRLKGYSIAIDVFGRDETFDSQTDPVVRLEARRLRRDLEHYYLTAGKGDPVQISIPKGAYAPAFEWQDDAVPSAVDERPTVVKESLQENDSGSTSRRARRWVWVAASVLAIAGVGAVVWQEFPLGSRISAFDTASSSTTGGDFATSVPKGPLVAVLPFRNLSGDPGQDYISYGITYEIISRLAKFRTFNVLSLLSTMRYQTFTKIPDEIDNATRADFLLDGTIQIEKQSIIVLAVLTDTNSKQILWSEKYERPFNVDQILSIQADLAERLSAIVGDRYGVIGQATGALGRGTPTSNDAYNCVLHFYAYQQSMNQEGHADVRECLQDAVRVDPTYSQAWASLSTAYAQEYRMGLNPRPDAYDAQERALDAAKRAVASDPMNPIAHLVLAHAHFDGQRLEAFNDAGERALSLNPNNPEILAHYGMRLAFTGHWDRGLALLDKARQFNPYHPSWHHVPYAFYHYEKGDYERALAEGRKIDMPQFVGTHLGLAACLGQLDRVEEAQAASRNLVRSDPDYPKQFWERLRVWNIPRSLGAALADGLRKAGLDIPPAPADS